MEIMKAKQQRASQCNLSAASPRVRSTHHIRAARETFPHLSWIPSSFFAPCPQRVEKEAKQAKVRSFVDSTKPGKTVDELLAAYEGREEIP